MSGLRDWHISYINQRRSGRIGEQTPRSEVGASLRDLNSGSNQLPWTIVILSGTTAPVQRAVCGGPAVVYSKAVKSCSGRGGRKHAIAPKRVANRHAAGGVGRPASAIATPSTADSNGGTRASAIGNVGASVKPPQPTRHSRARASAQRQRQKIFASGRATDRVATNFSLSLTTIRASVFAAWRAARPYVASWIARRAIGPGGDAGVGSV
jgi:hypothetical protein